MYNETCDFEVGDRVVIMCADSINVTNFSNSVIGTEGEVRTIADNGAIGVASDMPITTDDTDYWDFAPNSHAMYFHNAKESLRHVKAVEVVEIEDADLQTMLDERILN
ncbi:MAG: hypothetical protein RR365_01125 [Bacteroides sp.]